VSSCSIVLGASISGEQLQQDRAAEYAQLVVSVTGSEHHL
jgi:hypothetical protein